MKSTIIIVGAGAAGLMAARELSASGNTVIVLESQAQAGGRIQSITLTDGNVVEGGAEFIHGHLPLTIGLCKEGNIGFIPVEGKMYRREKGEWVEETQMVEGWEELIKKMGAVKQDMTLEDFLISHYTEEKYTELRMHLISYVQGFDLADPGTVSVRALYEEWSHEDEENFRIPAGYDQLIRFLESQCVQNGCAIHKGDAVRQIDWQQDEVTAYTATGKKYNAEKIIVTVPLGVLTDIAGETAINFTPAIDEQIRAAANIGYGTVIKVVVQFNRQLWKPGTRFIFSQEMIPTWWTQYPLDNYLLTGWAGGPKAEKLAPHTDSELEEIALRSLSNVFGLSIEAIKKEMKACYLFNWKQHTHARGGYSFPTLHTTAARKFLRDPLQNTVYFAGEGLYQGEYPGTVEAALSTGKQIARIINHSS